MITYSEIVNEVAAIMEIGNTDLGRFNVVRNANNAQRFIINTLPTQFLENCIKTVKGDLENGKHKNQWPNDFLRFAEMWIDFENPITETNEGRQAVPYEDITNDEYYIPYVGKLATQDFPLIDINVEGGYAIYPVPDQDVVHGFRLRYVWTIPDIASDQHSLLRINLKNMLVFRTVMLSALVSNFNVELAQEYRQHFQDELSFFMPKTESKGR